MNPVLLKIEGLASASGTASRVQLEVQADRVTADFAVLEMRPGSWSVFHIPSGLAACSTYTRKRAVRVAETVQAIPAIDWPNLTRAGFVKLPEGRKRAFQQALAKLGVKP